MKGIGNVAFIRCDSLVSVVIPEGVSYIGHSAFSSCENLTSVSLPDSLKEMPANPFDGSYKLESIVVSPDHPSLEVVDGVLFDRVDKRLIVYPNSGKFIPERVYMVPAGTRIIGPKAFAYNSWLERIILPEGELL